MMDGLLNLIVALLSFAMVFVFLSIIYVSLFTVDDFCRENPYISGCPMWLPKDEICPKLPSLARCEGWSSENQSEID